MASHVQSLREQSSNSPREASLVRGPFLDQEKISSQDMKDILGESPSEYSYSILTIPAYAEDPNTKLSIECFGTSMPQMHAEAGRNVHRIHLERPLGSYPLLEVTESHTGTYNTVRLPQGIESLIIEIYQSGQSLPIYAGFKGLDLANGRMEQSKTTEMFKEYITLEAKTIFPWRNKEANNSNAPVVI
jgi:hypothetical protein